MKKAISLALIVVFVCIGFASCGLSADDLETKVNGAVFMSTESQPYETIIFYVDKEASVFTSNKYGQVLDTEYLPWSTESSLTGAYVSIGGEKYTYDADDDTLTRQSDKKVFKRNDEFRVD